MWSRSDERELSDAFKSMRQEPAPATLRERLQDDLEARTKPSAATLRAKALVTAGAVLMAALCVGIIVTTFRGQDVLAATLEAMAGVRTVHMVITEGEDTTEVWYSADHGVREQTPEGIRISNPEGTREYYPDTKTVVISEPKPRMADLTSLSGSRWLDGLRRSELFDSRRQLPDALLDGAMAKRVELESTEHRFGLTVWSDAETMRLVQMESWRPGGHAGRAVYETTRINYDLSLDPAMFPTPPPDATVIDYRPDPTLLAVIKQAADALRTLPVHEVSQNRPLAEGEEPKQDSWPEWEAWRQGGVGYRIEPADGYIQVGNRGNAWSYRPKDRKCYLNQYNDETTRPHEHQWLRNMPEDGTHIDRNEVAYRQQEGRRFVDVVIRPRYGLDDSAWRRSKRVYTFDLESNRLVQHETRSRRGDDWRFERRVRIDYPRELPDGIFGFNPPPGARVEQGLKERWQEKK